MPRPLYQKALQGHRTGAAIRLWLALLMTGALALLPSGPTMAAYSTDVQFISAPSSVTGIACPTSTTCYVASRAGGTFSEGGEWESGTVTPLTIDANGTIQSGSAVAPRWVPGVRGGGLAGIACPGPGACYVVGRVFVHELESGGAVLTKGGVAAMTSANGTVTGHNIRWVDGTVHLNAIACPTSNICYAVGHNGIEGVVLSIAVDGGSVDPNSYAVVTHASALTGIACPTSTTCYAVGYLSNQGVVVALNTADVDDAGDGGEAGSVQVIGGTSELSGIACPSSTACYASGNDGSSGQLTALTINGSSIAPNFTQTILGTSALEGIACADASTCYAVGNVYTGDSSTNAVIVQFALLNSPVQQVLAVADLSGIACSGGACYAAGINSVTSQSVVTTIEPQALITTSLSLDSSANPSDYGQAVTVAAAVEATGGANLPTGWVQFYIEDIAFGAPVPLVDHLGQAQAVLTLPNLPPGSHKITGIYGGDTTFSGSLSSPLTQTVNKAVLTITADDQTVVSGDDIPALTWTPSGFVNGDSASVLTGAPSLSTTATTGSAPGDYPITIGSGTLAAANYTFTFDDGTLTITNPAPSADAGPDQTVDEGATVTLDGSNSSDPDDDTLTYAWELVSQAGPAITLSSETIANPSFATTDNGNYLFQLTVSDGNGGTDSDTVTIIVGNVAPTATFDAPDSVVVGSSIELSLTDPADPAAADTLAGFSYAFDCGSGYGTFGASSTASCPTSESGPRTVKGKIRDKDGGEREYTQQVNILADSTPPTGTISINAGETYTNETVITLTLTCQDSNSGCDQMAFSTNGITFTPPQPFATSTTITLPGGDGTKTVSARFTDVAGNQSTAVSDSITLDQTAPETTITSTNPSTTPTNQTSISIDFGGSDSSGIAGYECALDGVDFTACTSPQPYAGLSDGAHTFRVRAVDLAGNVESNPAEYAWTVDTIPPTVTIEQALDQGNGQNDPTNSSSITFDVVFSQPVSGFEAADVQLSGTANPQTVTVSPPTGPSSTYTVTVSGMTADGTVSASIPAGAANDAAGNLSAASTSEDNTVTVIRTPPVTTATVSGPQGQAGWYRAASVTLVSDKPATTTYAINGGAAQTYTAPFALTPDGTYTLTFASVDALGNQEVTQSLTITVDSTAPVIQPLVNQALDPTSPAGAPVVFSAVVSDNLTLTDQLVVACVDQSSQPFVSGQTAPIGTATTITCTVTDLAGNTAVTSFTVTVASLADLFDGLGAQIDATDTGFAQQRQLLLYTGIAESLASWSPRMSCLQLTILDFYIRSQVARHRITTRDATLLYAQTRDIRNVLGCGG